MHNLTRMNWPAFIPILLVLGAITYWSCKSSKEAQKSKRRLLYELERTGCLGKCPVYRIEIFSDLTLHITPRRNLPIEVDQSATIAHEEFANLQRILNSAAYQALDSSYDNGVTDAPFTILTDISNNMKVRCRGDAPSAFNEAIMAIERMAINQGWLIGEQHNTSQERELILEIDSEEHIANLEEKYRLVLIKKLSPRQSYYLFQIDLKGEQEQGILNQLRNDPLIREAQWNHKLNKR